MTRKFTFLLMALLALAGLQGWGQEKGYTYTQLTGLPESGVQYYLGYQSGNTWYLYVSGDGSTGNPMVLGDENSAKPFDLSQFQTTNYCTAKCEGQDLMSNTLGSAWGNRNVFDASQGYINFVIAGQALYHNANNEITTSGNSTQLINFYKRTGSSAPTYTVTVTSDTEGCTASADKASYEEGETVTLSYEADAFHYFTGYESSDVTITGSTFAMPANNVSVTAHFAAKPTHSITATVNPENAGTASVTYQSNTITEAPAGAVLNLSAIANPGFDFVSWTIGDEVVSTSANYNYTMPDNDVVIVANFGEHQLLHVNIDPNIVGGTITVNPSECDPGTTVTVTPNAASGYQYVYGNITVTDANGQPVYVYQSYPSSTFTMPSTDVTVSATFIKSYSISIGSHQHCTVSTSPMGSAIANADVTVLITPEAGYRVTNVTATYEGGQITAVYDYEYNGVQYYSFTMPAYDVTVNVVCALTYTVNYTQPAGGTISVSPTTNVPASQSVSISIDHIQPHYSFDYANYASKISVKDASENPIHVNQEDDTHYNFTMPASNVTVSVTFDQDDNYDIAVTPPEGCTIEVSPSENVYAYEPVYLSYYNVQTGYQFVEWVVKDGETTITPEYDYYYGKYYFTMPASENVTVTATVEALTAHTVNIAEGIIGGSVSARTDNYHEAPITAYAGEYVYLTNTPDPGYQFVSFTVTSECGTVEVYNDFYFNMPDCDVTVSATFALAPQDLTVNDGTTTNYEVPFDTYYTFCSTKSQFIIPAEQLQSMFDGTITDLTFYINYNNNFDFGNARWNVYVKEVDYQTLNDYASTEGMTLVYNGGMAITNGQMHIDFDTDFEYNDSNLLICFEQIQAGNYLDSKPWYGVYTGKPTAYAGYDYGYGLYSYAQTFLPKTTIKYMPSANPQTRYEIAINNPEGTTINASKTMATQGTIITLSKSLEEGYVFNNWVVMQGETPVDVENDQFEMPAGAVTVTANVTAPTYYNVYLDPNTDYAIYADPVENILAGKTITLSDAAESGKTVDTWTVTERTSGMPVEVTFNDDYNLYQFTMPNDHVNVTATFRNLKECTVNFYVNGVKWEEKTENVFENEYIYFEDKVLETTPAGTTFTGWKTSEIETFETEYPQNIYSQWGYFQVKDNTDFYAVFSFTEKVPTGESRWSQLTMLSQLEDGDEVVFEGYQYDYSTSTGIYYLLAQRNSEAATDFGRTDGMSWNELNQGNFPEGTIVFTAVNNAGSWNFMYEDAFVEGTSALAVNSYGSMGPKSYLGGYDNWSIYSNDGTWTSGYTYNVETNNYINFDGSRFYGGGYNNAASLYRRVIQTDDHNYYMTNVLGFGGADEHITDNTEATNVVIAKNAKLTVDNGVILNVEGICLSASHDAAQLVIADGGQLIHNNAGTMATFQKNITGYTGDNDHYYLIANPTDENDVYNLANNEFDLYTFDPREKLEWQNQGAIGNTDIVRNAGYLYANAATTTLQFRGELLPAGGATIDDLKYYDGNEAGHEFPGFNLIGNPFACNATISGTDLRSSNYYYMMNAGGTALEVVVNPILAPCTGVFAVAANRDATVTFTQANTNGIDVTRSEKNAVQDIRVELLANGKVIDRAYLNMNGESLPKFRLQDNISEICFYQDKEELAVVSTSSTSGEIPVSFKAEKNGSYTINVNTENVNAHYIHLIDNLTGADVDLLSTPSYTFNASTSDYAYRFKLVFSMTGVEENGSNANSYAYISNGNLVIDHIEGEATMQIVDMLGRVVSTEIVSGSYNKALNLKAGLYIINLNGMTQKIVVK